MEDTFESQQQQFFGGEGSSNNTSLAINKLENAFEQNENQIDLMENFIKSKTSEIATLQQYLIGEFQNIENTKARNKKIEKILVTQALPVLKEIGNKLSMFEDCLTPFMSVATAYITTLAFKAQELLTEKQSIIDKQAQTIKQLQYTLQKYQNNVRYSAQHRQSYQKEDNSSNIKGIVDKFMNHEPYQLDKKVQKIQQQLMQTPQKLSRKIYQKEQANDPNKSPNKPNKYELCYQNILENKKLITYRCQKSRSPLKATPDLNRKSQKSKQQYGIACERKDYIKQKIEKIKIRTECKEKKNQFALYEKNY